MLQSTESYHSLIVAYFRQQTPVQVVWVRSSDNKELLQRLNSNGLQWSLGEISSGGVYFDMESDSLTQNDFNFNSSYYWLVKGQFPGAMNQFNLQFDTHLTFFDSNLTLFNIWSTSKSLMIEEMGCWNSTFMLSPTRGERNLSGTELETTIYVSDLSAAQNQTTALLSSNFTKEGASFQIMLQVKYFHTLNLILSEKFKFSIKISKITEDIETYGDLNETDILSAGALLNTKNLHKFHFIFSDFYLQEDLFYLLTPELVSGQDYLTFLSPLDTDVWITFCLFLLLIAALIKCFGIITQDQNVEVIIQVVGTVAMQGINPMPHNTSLRLIMLSGLVLMLVLFNLYTASLLGVILTQPKDKFHDSAGVVSSQIGLARMNNYYSEMALTVRLCALHSNKM